MRSLNLSGFIGKDAELKQRGDYTVASFTISANQGKDKETLWMECVVWGKRATTVKDYFKKGMYVSVQGDLETYTYKEKRYYQCNVKDFDFPINKEKRQQTLSDNIPF